ncbi:pyrroline-5-carboxylate reductase [Spirochaetota bacterium]
MSSIKKKKIGCIGVGNMGGAIVLGLEAKIPAGNLNIFDTDKNKLAPFSKKDIITSASIEALVKNSDIIIIAVKPDTVNFILDEIKNLIDNKIILSIAAGISNYQIEKRIGHTNKIIRVMPNTPSLAGEGMIVMSPNGNVNEESLTIAKDIFSSIGKVMILPEKLMNAVTGLSGSGPAYVFTFIQALADGGVKMGIPRDKSIILAAQTVLGSAKLVLENTEDPITLRNMVTSPGGTTIDAVHILDRSGFAGYVIDAVETATKKSKKLGEDGV